MMKEVATIRFTEMETASEALAIIRYDRTSVAVCFSVESNGDIELVMRNDDARALIEALKKAVEGHGEKDG